MESEIRRLAINALTFLLEHATIDAIRFRGDGFTLLFDPVRVHADEIYLYLDAPWIIHPAASGAAQNIPFVAQIRTAEEQLIQLYSLRGAHITSITLGSTRPDLIIEFEDHRVFIMNGHDDRYESWELGTARYDEGAHFLIVATPGDRISVWVPKHFF